MNTLENNPWIGTKTTAKKMIDFLIGFIGSLIVGNIGIILLAQFDTPERWGINFTQLWRLAFAGLAIFIITKKRAWISLGIATAVLLQALEI